MPASRRLGVTSKVVLLLISVGALTCLLLGGVTY
jgi:hypothetical protein